jgi:hypothetical protein
MEPHWHARSRVQLHQHVCMPSQPIDLAVMQQLASHEVVYSTETQGAGSRVRRRSLDLHDAEEVVGVEDVHAAVLQEHVPAAAVLLLADLALEHALKLVAVQLREDGREQRKVSAGRLEEDTCA